MKRKGRAEGQTITFYNEDRWERRLCYGRLEGQANSILRAQSTFLAGVHIIVRLQTTFFEEKRDYHIVTLFDIFERSKCLE